MQVIENDREINKRWKPLYTKDYRFILYHGGRGGRKSWEIADSLIRNSVKEPLRILCTREIQNSIKESVHQLLVMRMKALGYAEEFIATNNDITHKITGTKFIFKGLNDINDKSTQSLKSLEDIDIVWIEEAQTITRNSLSILIPTIRKPNSRIIASFNPLYSDDAIWDLVENPRPRTYTCYVTYLDNPDISEEFVQEAEFYRINKPAEYEHIYLGKPKDMSDNTVVKYFTTENIKPIKYFPEWDMHITCDFNVDPMCWFLLHRTEEKYFYFDEIVIENTTVRQCVQEIISRYGNHQGKIIINGDASGDSRHVNNEFSSYAIMVNQLRKHFKPEQIPKPEIKKGNPPVQNRIAAWNEKVLTSKGERHIIISPKCKWLLYCIKTLKYKEGSENIIDIPTHVQIKTNKELKYLRDPFHAASYVVDFYHPIKEDKWQKNQN